MLDIEHIHQIDDTIYRDGVPLKDQLPHDLERMSRDIAKYYRNSMFDFDNVCRMAGGAR